MKLAQLLAEIGRAGSIASGASIAHYRQRLEESCSQSRGGVLKPDTVKLKIDGKTVQMPKFALLPPGAMELRRLSVEFESDVSLDFSDEAETQQSVMLELKKGLGKRRTTFKVNAEFERGEPIEAVERLKETAAQMLTEQLTGTTNGR